MTEPARAQPGGFARAVPLTLTVEETNSTMLLRMAGDLDLATAGQVTAALDRLDVDRITLLMLDLQELTFLDLAGLRAVLGVNDHCKKHGIRTTVLKPRGLAGRVFTLTRVLDPVEPRVHSSGADLWSTPGHEVAT